MTWIPANHKMRDAGIDDGLDQARTYLRATVPGADDDPRLEAFLARGDEALRFLEANTALKLQPVRRYPDYYPDRPGATAGGRVLEPVPFDGARAGAGLRAVARPAARVPAVRRHDDQPRGPADAAPRRPVRRAALWHAAKLAARYARQRLGAHRGTSLYLGNALAARLLKSLRDLEGRRAARRCA